MKTDRKSRRFRAANGPASCLGRRRMPRRSGAMIILMLFFLVVVVGMAMLSVDVGLMTVLRAEVQNAVDAGALAAALELQDNPRAIKEAEDAARRFVQLNRAGAGVTIPDDAIEVEHGQFDSQTGTFTVTDDSPNAVRVFARQDNERFSFARTFGHRVFGAPASAIAAGSSTPLDIMMVLDLSGSMAYYGRIQALWNSAPAFVDAIEECDGEDQIGVMGLSADPVIYPLLARMRRLTGIAYNSGLHPTRDHHIGILEAPLTDNFPPLKNVTLASTNLPAGKYGGPFGSYTGTGAAIGDAAHYLSYGAEARDEAEKIIVLMSDGYANRPSGNGPGYARQMAQYAADHDVTIYTISLGDDADVNLMEDIAELTGGKHFDARGAGAELLTQRLTEAFLQVATAIRRVQLVE